MQKSTLMSTLTLFVRLGRKNTMSPDAPRPTVSVKLTALHPRYEVANTERTLTELYDRVIELIKLARSVNIGITIDAEEMGPFRTVTAVIPKIVSIRNG